VSDKTETALRTIGEVSTELGIPQHILRYWETKFPQLRPVQRAGNRRYYRPEDIALARRIQMLLAQDGYTMKGVQKLLDGGSEGPDEDATPFEPFHAPSAMRSIVPDLHRIRAMLADALAA
jgi:DNA-binding transcriptional MerR regulator